MVNMGVNKIDIKTGHGAKIEIDNFSKLMEFVNDRV